MAETVRVKSLNREELHAWRAYAETVDDLRAALEADLAPHGVTLGDYQVLVYLSETDDRSMRMVDLAAKLHLSPSGLTRRLDGLCREGFVDRLPSTADRRVMLALLTHSGFAKLEEAYPTHLASVRRRIIDRIDARDLATFGRVFETIQAGLCAGQET